MNHERLIYSNEAEAVKDIFMMKNPFADRLIFSIDGDYNRPTGADAMKAAEAIAERETYFTVHHLDPEGDTDTNTLYTHRDGETAYEFTSDNEQVELYASVRAHILDRPEGESLIVYDKKVYLYATCDETMDEEGFEFAFWTDSLIKKEGILKDLYCPQGGNCGPSIRHIENLSFEQIREMHEAILYNIFGNTAKEILFTELKWRVEEPVHKAAGALEKALNMK